MSISLVCLGFATLCQNVFLDIVVPLKPAIKLDAIKDLNITSEAAHNKTALRPV